MRKSLSLCLTAALLGACVELDRDEEIASAEEAMIGGSPPAADWMLKRAAKPLGCTGTLIGRRHVLTAVHCTWSAAWAPGALVKFYDGSSFPSRVTVAMQSIHTPPGTSPGVRTDNLGRTADIAIVKLAADAPSASRVATMVWEYPGAGVSGHIVGGGNPDSQLLYNVSSTLNDDDDNGQFKTAEHVTDSGDSGGSFYDDAKLLGVTLGGSLGQGIFTSVPEHLPWILTTMAWTWIGGAPVAGYRYGDDVDTFSATEEKVCQYACDRSNCDAYNYAPAYDLCVLIQEPGALIASSVWRTALK